MSAAVTSNQNQPDSPLSIVGNVIGILTFFVALLASIVAYCILLRDAASELRSVIQELNGSTNHLEALETYFTASLQSTVDPEVEAHQAMLTYNLRTLRKRILSFMDRLEKTTQLYNVPMFQFDLRFQRRIVWAFRRQAMLDELARIEKGKNDINQILIAILFKKGKRQEIHAHEQHDLIVRQMDTLIRLEKRMANQPPMGDSFITIPDQSGIGKHSATVPQFPFYPTSTFGSNSESTNGWTVIQRRSSF